MSVTNKLGQPIGDEIENWKPVPRPPYTMILGRHCRLEPLNAVEHGVALFEAFKADNENRIWTYLPYGPFDKFEDFQRWMDQTCFSGDPMFHAIIDLKSDKAVGVASLMRIDPANGVIEVGHINYSPLLQKTIAASEAQYLLMKRVFDELGYRRYEWKCNALNAGSCRAAERYGFTFEGTFRQANVSKGRNRDTAWYSVLDSEWARIKQAFERWLSEENFTSSGDQIHRLSALMHNK